MKVTVYTTATCGYCRAEKDWLRQQKISFKEVPLDNDPQAQEEMIHLSGQLGVPFTVIETDDKKLMGVIGFDQGRLAQLLGIADRAA